MQEKNYFLLGLPHSGKTSFIGPLWHVIESGELVTSSYTMEIQPEDREYINGLRDKWTSCTEPERTIVGTIREIYLTLTDRGSNVQHKILIPDVSGETFAQTFETREMPSTYSDLIRGASGLLLFIHPDSAIPLVEVSALNNLMGSQPEAQNGTQIRDWTEKDCPPQVTLVDLIQIYQTLNTQKLKIDVIISAWDLITNIPAPEPTTPIIWLSNQFPLLFQFLNSNQDTIDSAVFGLSAQGGDYKTAKESLIEFDQPSQRIIVQFNAETSHDITLPLKWLFQ
jgi:hypothetical protein